jgi:hypothetical protein
MKRAEEMRELFARWKNSGQSLTAFGKREGVPYSKLLYWRRKFRSEDTPPPAPDLIPIHVIPDASAPAARPEPFEVWLANGVALNIAAGFDEHELRRLVDVLSTC